MPDHIHRYEIKFLLVDGSDGDENSKKVIGLSPHPYVPELFLNYSDTRGRGLKLGPNLELFIDEPNLVRQLSS